MDYKKIYQEILDQLDCVLATIEHNEQRLEDDINDRPARQVYLHEIWKLHDCLNLLEGVD